MIILKAKLIKDIAAIYDKTAQEPFAIVNVNNNGIDLIKQIESSSSESGIIYCAG